MSSVKSTWTSDGETEVQGWSLGIEMPELSRVVTFERAVIGFLALSSLSVAAAVAAFPPSPVTRAPKAVLAVPPAAMETHAGIIPLPRAKPASEVAGLTVGALSATFSNLNYDLDQLRAGSASVPRLFPVALPVDMSKIQAPERRKNVFFKTVLPLILRVNDEIRKERGHLLDLIAEKKKVGKLPAEDRLWLAALADRYDTERTDLDTMLLRVDTVPPSLALAQAAEESGWGTSRFAQEGNALFGQWTFSSTRGLVPRLRDEDKNHHVKRFDTLLDATRAYVLNLNTHAAYRPFRELRQDMREEGRPLEGIQLAGKLIRYSQRGKAYVETIRDIIASNRLEALDTAQLGDNVPPEVSSESGETAKPLI